MKRRRTFMMMIVMVMNMMMIPVEHRSKCDKVSLKLILSSPHNHRGTRRVCNLIKNVVICIIIIIVIVYDVLHSAVISGPHVGRNLRKRQTRVKSFHLLPSSNPCLLLRLSICISDIFSLVSLCELIKLYNT